MGREGWECEQTGWRGVVGERKWMERRRRGVPKERSLSFQEAIHPQRSFAPKSILCFYWRAETAGH